MIIGIPKEIKNHEYRVSLTPENTGILTKKGHQVLIENNAGKAIGFENEHYLKNGAKIVNDVKEIFNICELIIKVKEPQQCECKMLKENQILFTYLHLASDLNQTKSLMDSGCIAIAYEMVQDENNQLPLLIPMSEIAGKLAVQAGAHCLEKTQGGPGILLGGIAGIEPAKIVILGGGIVGFNAIKISIGMGSNVTVLDNSLNKLRELDRIFGSKLKCIYSTKNKIEEYLTDVDLLIGAVLIPGSSTPKLITKNMIQNMKKGSVIVDVSIDQGGCFETSKPTNHSNPTYKINEVIHYCVANIPSLVAKTSTIALNNYILPYIIDLADNKTKVFAKNKSLKKGLSIYKGYLTSYPVAKSLNLPYKDIF